MSTTCVEMKLAATEQINSTETMAKVSRDIEVDEYTYYT